MHVLATGVRRALGAGALALLMASTVSAADLSPGAVAARVGSEPIYVGELLESAASLALVGQQDAGERPGTREHLLERLIVARLLYLDGVARGLDRDSRLRDALTAADDATLAGRHAERLRQQQCAPLAGPCPELGAVRAAEVARLRAATDAPSADTTLLADAARRAGLDRDSGFDQMQADRRRALLVRLVRDDVVAEHGLDDAGVEREYARQRARFTLPAERQIQQIVVRTRAEADEIESLLAAPPVGTTFYTLARDRSIVPHAAQTLGMVGWVRRDQGHPALTAAAFALAPGAIGVPIETDAGFHVIRVVAERPEEVLPLDDDLRARIRERWNANRIAEYAQHLAETAYPVTLFPETYRSESTAQR